MVANLGWGVPNSQVVQSFGPGSEYDVWLQDFNHRRAIAQAGAEAERKANRENAFAALTSSASDNLTAQAGRMAAVLNPGPGLNGGSYDFLFNPVPLNQPIGRSVSDAPQSYLDRMPEQSSAPLDVGGYLNSLWGGGDGGPLSVIAGPEAMAAFEDARSRDVGFDSSPFDAEYAEKSKAAQAYAEALNRHGLAYQTQQGGGFLGGFMTDAYETPFFGTTSAGLKPDAAKQPNGLAGFGATPTSFGPLDLSKETKQMNAGWGGPLDGWSW